MVKEEWFKDGRDVGIEGVCGLGKDGRDVSGLGCIFLDLIFIINGLWDYHWNLINHNADIEYLHFKPKWCIKWQTVSSV